MTNEELIKKILSDDSVEAYERLIKEESEKDEPDYDRIDQLVEKLISLEGGGFPETDMKEERRKLQIKIDAYNRERAKRRALIFKVAAAAAVIILPVSAIHYINSKDPLDPDNSHIITDKNPHELVEVIETTITTSSVSKTKKPETKATEITDLKAAETQKTSEIGTTSKIPPVSAVFTAVVPVVSSVSDTQSAMTTDDTMPVSKVTDATDFTEKEPVAESTKPTESTISNTVSDTTIYNYEDDIYHPPEDENISVTGKPVTEDHFIKLEMEVTVEEKSNCEESDESIGIKIIYSPDITDSYFVVSSPEKYNISIIFKDEPDVWYNYAFDELLVPGSRAYTSIVELWESGLFDIEKIKI